MKLDDKSAEKLKHLQVIVCPAQTIWSAVFLPNGDIAAAGSDGRIYIYTQEEKRLADKDLQESINEELAARVAKALEAKEKQESDVVVIKVAIDDSVASMELRYVKGEDPTIAAEQFLRVCISFM